jgi:iron complex outermembrane receptor protein
MRTRINKVALCVSATLSSLLLASPSLLAKDVYLQISDENQRPLKNALVKVVRTDIKGKTDNQGKVTLDLDYGEYVIDVEASLTQHFHRTITVKASEDSESTNPITISLRNELEHKIVIHANPMEHTSLDMATPVSILSGEELVRKRASTIGEMLQYEPGINFSSFGPSVARPIIRGFGSSRVSITNNQMLVQDASVASGDHDVGIEPLLIEQLEVVKGSASLLYGSGAIGGVVNAVDNKISKVEKDGFSGGVELRKADDVTGERSGVFAVDLGVGQWNFHVDGYTNETDDLTIPVGSESVYQLLDEGEETDNANESAVLENSYSDASGGSFGISRIFEDGYIGLSHSKTSKKYGLPGHAHHEEEHDEHEEEDHDEHEEEESVFLDLEQSVTHLQAEFDNPMKGVERWFAGYSYTDYQHQEIEGGELGTEFINKAREFKTYINHSEINGWDGIVGVQSVSRDFSAIGEEAFVPPSETRSNALFWLEEKHFGSLKWELGARFEKQKISLNETRESLSKASYSSQGFSYSAGAVYDLKSHNKLAFNFTHAQRFPNAEELFSYGPHLASSTFEIGNENLVKESANNLDFSYRFENLWSYGEFNLFYNRFNDYVFADVVTENDACVDAEAAEEAEHDELSLICYRQSDATYKGAELAVTFPLGTFGNHNFELDVFGDYLTAKKSNGEYLPRIPANKWGLSLAYDMKDLSADISWIKSAKQSNLSTNEFPTNAYTSVELDLAYRVATKSTDWYLFLKGKNLLDEEIRDHASFIKDLAPRAGRHWVAGVRFNF